MVLIYGGGSGCMCMCMCMFVCMYAVCLLTIIFALPLDLMCPIIGITFPAFSASHIYTLTSTASMVFISGDTAGEEVFAPPTPSAPKAPEFFWPRRQRRLEFFRPDPSKSPGNFFDPTPKMHGPYCLWEIRIIYKCISCIFVSNKHLHATHRLDGFDQTPKMHGWFCLWEISIIYKCIFGIFVSSKHLHASHRLDGFVCDRWNQPIWQRFEVVLLRMWIMDRVISSPGEDPVDFPYYQYRLENFWGLGQCCLHCCTGWYLQEIINISNF